MRIALPASVQAIEEFFGEVRLTHKALLSRVNCLAADLLSRRSVKASPLFLRLKGRRILTAVQDDGDGFDWRAAWRDSADLSDCSCRGIEILCKYANHVRYNDRGNVAMLKRLLRLRGNTIIVVTREITKPLFGPLEA